jgi:plastocyanin
MPRRGSSHGRLRRLALAAALVAALAGLTSEASGQEPAATEVTVAPAAQAPAVPAPAAAPAPTTVSVSRASSSATRSVSIIDFEYQPADLTIKTGDTVTWINNGTADEGHNVVGGELESPTLHTGESYSHTFQTAGTIDYVCTIHPDMKGAILVLDRSAGKSPKKDGSRGSGGGSSGGGSSDSGSDIGSTTPSSGSRSESAAGSDPAGSSGSLPATGQDVLPPAAVGLGLFGAGLGLRRLRPRRA